MKCRASGWGHKVDHAAIGARSPGFKSCHFPHSTSDWERPPGLWRPEAFPGKTFIQITWVYPHRWFSVKSPHHMPFDPSFEIQMRKSPFQKFIMVPSLKSSLNTKCIHVFPFQIHSYHLPHCLWCCSSKGKLAVAETEGVRKSQGKMPRCHTQGIGLSLQGAIIIFPPRYCLYLFFSYCSIYFSLISFNHIDVSEACSTFSREVTSSEADLEIEGVGKDVKHQALLICPLSKKEPNFSWKTSLSPVLSGSPEIKYKVRTWWKFLMKM